MEQAHELGYTVLALTDECSLAGVVRAHGAAKTCGLKLIIGSEFCLEDGLRLVLLARNRAGYGDALQCRPCGSGSAVIPGTSGTHDRSMDDMRHIRNW